LKLSDFDYILPKELIAQYPLKKRDSCRLMVLDRKKQAIEHKEFGDLIKYPQKNDLFILNDTKVLPCRLKGRRPTGGKAEMLLLKQKKEFIFDALIKPSRIKIGERIKFSGGTVCGVISAKNEVTFKDIRPETVYGVGVMPLPPYIKRDAEQLDADYYQTVYAKNNGAVAAPTAGLHFTKELIRDMREAGVKFSAVTLHVGHGTFKPVKIDDITKHRMEPEAFNIPDSAGEALVQARKNHARIFAVGTTSLRALESYARGNILVETDLFIYPGYKFIAVNCLLTNFHLPRTTLFMLVCAFAGTDFIKKAYAEAVDRKYRFYSYGDAMLIV